MLGLSFLLFFVFLGVQADAQNYVSPQKAEAMVFDANKGLLNELGIASYKAEMTNSYTESGLRIQAYNLLFQKLPKSVSTLETINEVMEEVQSGVVNSFSEGQGPVSIEFEKSSFTSLREHLTEILTK